MAEVKHFGEVVRIETGKVYVRITVNSACSECHARGVCGVGESADKIVEVDVADASQYNVGEEVEVALQSRSMGTKSVVLAYVLPFLVLTLLMVGALMVGLSEGMAVLAGIGGVALYYFVLYFTQNKVKNIIKFIIIKQTK